LIQQCLYLYQCDLEGRFLDTAEIHGRTLKYLFQSLSPSPITMLLFLTAMHTMLELAVLTQSSPIMTFEDWHPNVWQALWQSAETNLVSVCSETPADIHPAITSPYLRETLHRLRLYVALPSLEMPWHTPEGKGLSDMFAFWAATRLVDDAVHLLQHFLDLQEASKSRKSPSCASTSTDLASTTTIRQPAVFREDAKWESMLTLTLFCTLRNYAHSAFLDVTEIDLRDASLVLAPIYMTALEAISVPMPTLTPTTTSSHSSQPDREDMAEVLLWIYFTGAMFEQRKSLYRGQMLDQQRQILIAPTATTTTTTINTSNEANDETQSARDRGRCCSSGSPEVDKTWYFTRSLANHARYMNITAWIEAKEILFRFVHADFLQPNPKCWWDSIFDF
jgi:hypothetical protein